MLLEFRDGTTKVVSLNEAASLAQLILQALAQAAEESSGNDTIVLPDFIVFRDDVKDVLRQHYGADARINHRAGRLWGALGLIAHNRTIEHLSASFILEAWSHIIDGDMNQMGPITRRDYRVVRDWIKEKMMNDKG